MLYPPTHTTFCVENKEVRGAHSSQGPGVLGGHNQALTTEEKKETRSLVLARMKGRHAWWAGARAPGLVGVERTAQRSLNRESELRWVLVSELGGHQLPLAEVPILAAETTESSDSGPCLLMASMS